MQIETKCLHEGYKSGNGEPLALPIYQSTTYTYDSTEHIGKLFDLTAPGHMYSRISNPTVGYVEEKIAALEGGVGCLMTTSGQAASFMSLFNILSAGDSFAAASKIYGGTVNLFAVTMKRMGIRMHFRRRGRGRGRASARDKAQHQGGVCRNPCKSRAFGLRYRKIRARRT